MGLGFCIARLTVYNFALADFHTYYVTEAAILVHNCNDLANKVKAKLNLYPKIIDSRTGRNIPLPHVDAIIPKAQRVNWDSVERYNFIKAWHDKGFTTPKGGWDKYDIHHIKPRAFGGTNDFNNLVPVERETHKLFNSFWSLFGDL